MKRTICLVLALMMILSFAACGKADDGSQPTEPADAAQSGTPDEPTAQSEIRPVDQTVPDFTAAPENISVFSYIMQVGDTVYYTDETGLWSRKGSEEPVLLAKGEIERFACDGRRILYLSYYREDTSVSDYIISVMNIDGTENKELRRSSSAIKAPLQMYNGVLYYYEKEGFGDGKLIAYDTVTKTSQTAADKVTSFKAMYNGDIYITVKDEDKNQYLCRYELASGELKRVGGDNFFVTDRQEVYAEDDGLYTVASETDDDKLTVFKVYKIDPADDSAELVIESDKVKTTDYKNSLIYKAALYYVRSDDDVKAVYKLTQDGSAESPADIDREGRLYLVGSGFVITTPDYQFYCDGDSIKTIEGLDKDPDKDDIMLDDGDGFYYYRDREVRYIKKQLSDSIPPSKLSSEPEHTRPLSQENGYVTTDKAMTVTFRGVFNITGQTSYTPYDAPCRLPRLLISGDDAAEVNEEIQSIFGRNFEQDPDSVYVPRTDYVCYLNGDILSLAIESYDAESHDSIYRVYDFDVSAGKRLSDEETAAMADISIDDIQAQIMEEAPERFKEITGSTVEMSESDIEETKTRLSKARYYFDSDKNLLAVYTLRGTPGAGSKQIFTVLDAHMK